MPLQWSNKKHSLEGGKEKLKKYLNQQKIPKDNKMLLAWLGLTNHLKGQSSHHPRDVLRAFKAFHNSSVEGKIKYHTAQTSAAASHLSKLKLSSSCGHTLISDVTAGVSD